MQAGAFFISAFAFITLVQLIEPTFSGWADVFFFCGKNFEFCNCNLSWNLLGTDFPLLDKHAVLGATCLLLEELVVSARLQTPRLHQKRHYSHLQFIMWEIRMFAASIQPLRESYHTELCPVHQHDPALLPTLLALKRT